MKRLHWISLIIVVVFMACSSSKITTAWKSPSVVPQYYNKILVLGLISDKDRAIQERMEKHIMGDLKDLGYNAVSALEQYGPKAFDNLDEKSALEKIKNSGADAVLTVVLLSKERERKYVAPQRIIGRPFWDYYGFRYGGIYEPGYYVTDTKYFWESNFYTLKDQSLLYSVQTKSFSPESIESMGHEYGLLIVKNMIKQKILIQKLAEE